MINRSLLNLIEFESSQGHFSVLNGIEIKVAIVEDPPFAELVYGSDGTVSRVNGYLGKLWTILEEQLRFRTIWVMPTDRLLGENNNGSWDGLLGELQRKEADVALINMAITKDRKTVVDFSAPVSFDSWKLLSNANSETENISWMIFLTALSWQIWVCVVALWISLSVSLAFVAKREVDSTNYNYLFALFGAITLQGCELTPNSFQGRLIFISFWAMCVVMYASFTARLTTQLTAPNPRIINNLEQALNKGFKICVITGSQQQQIFMESKPNDIYHRIGNMLQENPKLIVANIQQGLELVATNKKIMFLYDSNSLQYATRRNCSFRLEEASYFQGYSHLPYRKNLPYGETLDKMILRLNSNGALSKLTKNWQSSLGLGACISTTDEIPSLGLSKTLFAFVVLVGGAGTALLFLLIEMSLKKKKNDKKKELRQKVLSKDDFWKRNVLQNNFFDSNSAFELNPIGSLFKR